MESHLPSMEESNKTRLDLVDCSKEYGNLESLFCNNKGLYGRQEEKKIILDVVRKGVIDTEPINSKSTILILQAEEGMGKTALLEESLNPNHLQQNNGELCLVIPWKFCQTTVHYDFDANEHSNTSITTNHPEDDVDYDDDDDDDEDDMLQILLDDAFTALTQQILTSGESIVSKIQNALLQHMDLNDRLMLADMVPCIVPVLLQVSRPIDSSSSTTFTPGCKLHIISQFIQIVAQTTTCPLILLMDNFQYAPVRFLRLFDVLLHQNNTYNSPGIVYVLSTTPTIKSKPIQQFIRSIQRTQSEILINLTLQPLDTHTTHRMISDILHTNLKSSATLHSTLCPFLHGNPRCLLSYMTWMYHNHFLTWDNDTNMWSWDIPKLQLHCQGLDPSPRNDWNQLSQSVQELLKVASCFGNNISTQFLQCILGKPVEPDLYEARKHGWLLSNQEPNYQKGEDYVFASSKVRMVAYSMITKAQRDTFHLMIGRKLWREFHNSEMTPMLPPKYQSLVLKHMLLGSRVVTNVEERTAIISLCLAVVKEHVMWSSFSTAAALLKKGRRHLLDDRSWRNDYDVTLALRTVSAEVSYILGDFGVVNKQCSAIFQHARLVDHTIPACSVKISILSAAGNTDEALSMGLNVLKKIGVHVIAMPSKFQMARTLIKLRKLLRKICPATIRQLPLMSDPQKAAAMQIINHMLMPAHFGRESLFLILVSKLIDVTVQHGLCNVSSVAFGWYSLLLVIMGESALASQYGDLAIELLNRFGSKQWLPRVYLSVFGGLYAWTQSITKIIAPLSQAFEIGIQTGDIEYAFLNVILKNLFELYIGRNLADLSLEGERVLEVAVQFNYMVAMFSQKAMIYTLRGLIDGDYQETMDILVELQDYIHFPSTTSTLNYLTRFWRMILAFILCDYDRAVLEATTMEGLLQRPYLEIDLSIIFTVDVLARMTVLSSNADKGSQNRRSKLAIVRKRISILQKFAAVNPQLCEGIVSLVQAKVTQSTRYHHNHQHKSRSIQSTNIGLYQKAIYQLGHGKLLSIQAIACEDMARYMLVCGQEKNALNAMKESWRLYEEWGAVKKCNLLQDEIDLLQKCGGERG